MLGTKEESWKARGIMSKPDEEFLKKLISVFRVESKERSEKLASYLLDLQQETDNNKKNNLIETTYREIHSLKSAARAVNFEIIEKICKELEDVFYVYKQKTKVPKNEDFDALHEAVNFIIDFIQKSEEGPSGSEEKNLAPLISGIRQILNPEASETRVNTDQEKSAPAQKTPTVKTEMSKENINDKYKEKVDKHAMEKVEGNEKDRKKEAKREESSFKQGEDISKKTNEQTESPEKTNISIEETVRISTNKLDSLLAQAEEMISFKLNLVQRVSDAQILQEQMHNWYKEWIKTMEEYFIPREISKEGNLGLTSGLIEKYKELVKKLEFLSRDLEHNSQTLGSGIESLLEDTKKLLMWPFSTLLTPFPRTARELARSEGKEVNLVLEGTDVEIDKRILEEMKDVILHLIRNAIDHGIESKEERISLNKPPMATLKISIQQLLGNKISVEISDDGSGINLDKLRNSAVKQNILSLEEAKQLSNEEALSLIYHSGISTSPILTDLSGRGLGMSIVQEKIEKVSGKISVTTKPKVGTTFTIVLPLTLATFKGVLIEVSNQLYIIPTSNLERIIRIDSTQVNTAENKEIIFYLGKPTSLVRLNEVLGLPHKKKSAEKTSHSLPIMIISSPETTIAFVVDTILNEQEFIVKNFISPLKHIKNIAAAAILETGKPVPILNSLELLQSAQTKSMRTAMKDKIPDTMQEKISILLAEDSISTRMLLKNILELGGYQVTTAVDGMDAWQQLQTENFSVVVSDIEMPRMNGFELTEKIRQNEKTEQLPIILVTSRETEEDKSRGIEAGANAYLPKSTFDSSHLLEIIQRLTI